MSKVANVVGRLYSRTNTHNKAAAFQNCFSKNTDHSFIHSPGFHENTPKVNLSMEVNIQHLLQVVLPNQPNYRAILMMIETHSHKTPHRPIWHKETMHFYLSLMWKDLLASKVSQEMSAWSCIKTYSVYFTHAMFQKHLNTPSVTSSH